MGDDKTMSNTSAPTVHADCSTRPDQPQVHIVSLRTLIGVIVALLIFTGLTVAATRVDLGEANLWIALALAVLKASLVGLYFMHLRWDNLFHAVILLCALLFVVLFIGISLVDTIEYQPDLTRTPTRNAAP